ncbi:hypothetical protein BD408DRAFT_429647 [Parasitella parasitica]|nr:hypothetical protein BD408DRAFT_429647 [Parasitella parasitica]
MYPINTLPSTTAPNTPTTNTKRNPPQKKLDKSSPTSTLPPLLLNSLHQEWPLQEYQEKRIMCALSQQQLLSPLFDEEFSDEGELLDEEEDDDDDNHNISPTASYFSDRAIFQLDSKIRRQSLSNSLRCSLCQRRFHSQGNLSNHVQLYHY